MVKLCVVMCEICSRAYRKNLKSYVLLDQKVTVSLDAAIVN